MLERIVGMGRRLAQNAAFGLQRFPVSALLIIVFSIVSNLEAGSVEDFDHSARLLTALSLAATAGVIAALVAERHESTRRTRFLSSSLVAGIVGAIAFFAETSPYQLAGLSSALVLAVPLAPFIRPGSPAEFWTFGLWAAVGLIVAFLSAGLFLIGLYAIVEMVRTLFDTDVLKHADLYVLVTGLTLVAPLSALGRVPEVSPSQTALNGDERLANAIRPLFDWILAPLVWLAALVLHAYLVRAAFAGGFPGSEARWLLFVFCTLALALRIGADPFELTSSTPTRLFQRHWVWLMIAPIAALAIIQWRGISLRGLTPSSYYSSLWTATLACIILAQALPRLRRDIRWMVAIPILALLVSAFGPWSMTASVERSQISALRAMDPGLWQAADPSLRADIRERLAILEDVGGMDAVHAALPVALVAEKNLDTTIPSLPDLFLALGWDKTLAPPTPIRSFRASQGQAVSLTSYDLALVDLQTDSAGEQTGQGHLGLEADGHRLTIRFEGQLDGLDTGRLLRQLNDSATVATQPLVLDLVTENGRDIRLYVSRANYQTQPLRLLSLATTILIRADQWHGARGEEKTR